MNINKTTLKALYSETKKELTYTEWLESVLLNVHTALFSSAVDETEEMRTEEEAVDILG